MNAVAEVEVLQEPTAEEQLVSFIKDTKARFLELIQDENLDYENDLLFTEIVKIATTICGVKQKQLAYDIGVTQGMISRWICEYKGVSRRHRENLINALREELSVSES